MQIILATIANCKVINEIAHKTWPTTYGNILSEAQYTFMLEWMYRPQSLEQQFKDGQIFLLAQQNNNTIGFASCELNYKNTTSTKLHKLYVLPEAQGLGAGLALMQEVKNLANQHNNNAVLLNVNRFNNAKDFYLKNGFQIIAEEDIDIGNGYLMEDYVMEKKI